MVTRRSASGALLLALTVGCGGGTPTPVSPPPQASTGSLNHSASQSSTTDTPAAAAPGTAGPLTEPEPETPFQLEDGFTLLAFSDFEAFGSESETWQVTPEGVKCTGKPRGYLYSKQPFQNFTLRLDYRFTRPESLKDEAKFKGNTGFLMYITGEHKLWPVSLEVQGKHVQMAAIKENGGAQPVTATDDDAARQKARHAVGKWNSIEIVSTDGVLEVSLNGTPISKCEPDFLSEGLIGIQSEDFPFEVRRMRIRRN
jgi:hypothetical protein